MRLQSLPARLPLPMRHSSVAALSATKYNQVRATHPSQAIAIATPRHATVQRRYLCSRVVAFVAGGVVPLHMRGTRYNGLAHSSDWCVSLFAPAVTY